MQLLEGQLMSIAQCDMIISQYFTKIKTLCREIIEFDEASTISNDKKRRIIIHGLQPQYRGIIATIQG